MSLKYLNCPCVTGVLNYTLYMQGVFFPFFLNLQASHGNLNVGQTVKNIAQ